ncbi:hypothetical protein C8R45DRAFT_928332 [Mycena sanguinolenta]|nr:hypothetical protein C8R45DRAFT_928332 [Mycena sanguinolenta]
MYISGGAVPWGSRRSTGYVSGISAAGREVAAGAGMDMRVPRMMPVEVIVEIGSDSRLGSRTRRDDVTVRRKAQIRSRAHFFRFPWQRRDLCDAQAEESTMKDQDETYAEISWKLSGPGTLETVRFRDTGSRGHVEDDAVHGKKGRGGEISVVKTATSATYAEEARVAMEGRRSWSWYRYIYAARPCPPSMRTSTSAWAEHVLSGALGCEACHRAEMDGTQIDEMNAGVSAERWPRLHPVACPIPRLGGMYDRRRAFETRPRSRHRSAPNRCRATHLEGIKWDPARRSGRGTEEWYQYRKRPKRGRRGGIYRSWTEDVSRLVITETFGMSSAASPHKNLRTRIQGRNSRLRPMKNIVVVERW